MEEKRFFEYEKGEIKFPRNHFRNMSRAKDLLGFPFDLIEKNSFYTHPYDIYSDPQTDSYIWTIGGDAHCHTEKELGKYKEGIVLYCKPEDKEALIKRISKVA
ncbi:hypothetical protein J4226_06070 [Candidatus Pacearchaeota archaeon]|nr:hypothetical protein [Candidatus Pacearchaeota archaeon]